MESEWRRRHRQDRRPGDRLSHGSRQPPGLPEPYTINGKKRWFLDSHHAVQPGFLRARSGRHGLGGCPSRAAADHGTGDCVEWT